MEAHNILAIMSHPAGDVRKLYRRQTPANSHQLSPTQCLESKDLYEMFQLCAPLTLWSILHERNITRNGRWGATKSLDTLAVNTIHWKSIQFVRDGYISVQETTMVFDDGLSFSLTIKTSNPHFGRNSFTQVLSFLLWKLTRLILPGMCGMLMERVQPLFVRRSAGVFSKLPGPWPPLFSSRILTYSGCHVSDMCYNRRVGEHLSLAK